MDLAGKGDRPATPAITWEEPESSAWERELAQLRPEPERLVSELKWKLKLKQELPGASRPEPGRLVSELKLKLELERELPGASPLEWPLGLEREWEPELSVRER
jgi:hypothetical protein